MDKVLHRLLHLGLEIEEPLLHAVLVVRRSNRPQKFNQLPLLAKQACDGRAVLSWLKGDSVNTLEAFLQVWLHALGFAALAQNLKELFI